MSASQLVSLSGSKRYLRPIAALARAVRTDAQITLAPTPSFTDAEVRRLYKTAQRAHRAADAMKRAKLIVEITPEGSYTWTPVGRAMALAIRHMPDFEGQFSFRLSDFLKELPMAHLRWLASMPTLETVPEGLAILADFDLILQRTQTKKWGFRLMTAGDLIEFFNAHPEKAPQPSSIPPPSPGARADDMAASDRMAQALRSLHERFYGLAPQSSGEIDPAEFDWETDIWDFLL